LGEGSYGRVFLAKKAVNEFYAIKVIEKRKVMQLQKQAEVFKERKALIMLDHQCIVRMHWSFDVS
jgi:serine/threonine protein kinase